MRVGSGGRGLPEVWAMGKNWQIFPTGRHDLRESGLLDSINMRLQHSVRQLYARAWRRSERERRDCADAMPTWGKMSGRRDAKAGRCTCRDDPTDDREAGEGREGDGMGKPASLFRPAQSSSPSQLYQLCLPHFMKTRFSLTCRGHLSPSK